MDNINRIAGIVQSIGFECIRCGTCCSPVEMDSNLVMVTPAEIRQIMNFSGLPWQEIAEPYPEKIDDGNNRSFTIGWCIRRKNGECRFLDTTACSIYETRPWICMTYPFVLSDDIVQTFPCPGLGRKISWRDAVVIAKHLINRKTAECADEEKIRSVLEKDVIPSDFFVVIDCEGMKKVPR